MTTPSMRDPQSFGAHYAHDLIDEVESTSCALGCALAIPVSGTGPGGACLHLLHAFTDEPVPFVEDVKRVRCWAREPLPPAPPEQTECEGQVDLLTAIEEAS